MPGFPITITYFTKNRTLYQEKSNSKNTFNSILENFRKNNRYKKEAKLKKNYYINGREIRKNELLEEIVRQSNEFSPNLGELELSLELEELCFTGDSLYQNFNKIIHPKANPFSLYVLSPLEKSITVKSFPNKTISLFELNKFNDGSAYCNSYNDLYISGGNNNIKDFWIIDNNSFEIKKKNMPSNKKSHSMVFLNFNEKEEWIFIAGGMDKKSFYYDLNKNYFINWGDTNEVHSKPALIQVGEYLYIFDTINSRINYFERTKIISPNRKWEKIIPDIDKKIIGNFPYKFGVSFDSKGKILLLGGEKKLSVKNIYIYEPWNNSIILSQKAKNENMILDDKTFYKVNKKYSVAFPQKLNIEKVMYVADKEEQSVIKISLRNLSDKNKTNIASSLSFEDKMENNDQDKGNLNLNIIKKGMNSFKQQNNNLNLDYMNNQEMFNQMLLFNSMICDNCIVKNSFVCQCCHNIFQRHNFNVPMNYNLNNNLNNDFNNNYNSSYQQNKNLMNYNQMNQSNDNPTRENPKVTIIEDEYYPTLSSAYKKYLNNMKKKGYEHKIYNKNYNRALDKAKVEVSYDDYTPMKVDYQLNKPGEPSKKYVYSKKEKEKEAIRKNEEENINKKEEKININMNNNKNIENDVVEYKNFEENEQENKDDGLFISDNHNQNQNEVIIEENHNYNEEMEGIQEQNEEKEEIGASEKKEKIENKEDFIDMEEQNKEYIEKEENHEEQNVENIENNQNKVNISGEKEIKEENNIMSSNKGIINGELPKDSLEFNDAGKIHNEDENIIKPQHELDFNNEEINNQNQEDNINHIDNMRMGMNFSNNNENNNVIIDNKNENENEVRGDEEFHSMNENEENANGEDGNNSMQHIENGNNEELYENGNEIKFDGDNENNHMGKNVDKNGEFINNEDENKIVEYEGEVGEEMNVEEGEIHEENIGEEGEMQEENNGEEGEINFEQEGEFEGEGEEMNYEEEGQMNFEQEGEIEGEEMNNEQEEGMEEGNNSVIENNVENEQNEENEANSHNNENEKNGES